MAPPTHDPRARVGRAFVAVGAGTVLLLGLRAIARAALYDHYEVDLSPFDAGWMLQAPFRAARGEWIGRDLVLPRGPLWQLMSYVATGFGRAPWGWTAGADEFVFAAPAVGLAALLARRLPTARDQTVALAVVSMLVLWAPVDALRWMLTLAVALVFAHAPEERPARAGALAAGLATVTLMLSFERGVMAFASLALMAVASVVLTLRVASPRSQLPRIGGLLAGALVGQGVLALGFAVFSSSYVQYLRDLLALSEAYTVAMRLGDGAQHAPLLGLGACLALGAVAVGRETQAARDDAILLLGATPTLVAGLVRNDAPHIFMGASVGLGALTWVALRLSARDERRRAVAAAIVVGVALLGLLPTHAAPLRDWLALPSLAGGTERARLATRRQHYQGDVRRAAGWLMHRRRQGEAGCVALDESLGAAHAIAQVGGPVGLRWNPTLQDSRAARIESADCPHYVHRFFSQDSELRWAGWVFGEDFLTVARRYRPERRLGPAMTVLRRRDTPVALDTRPLSAEGLGEWRSVPADGALEWVLEREVPETSLVRIGFEVGASRGARLFDRVPLPEVAFVSVDGAETLRQPAPLMHASGPGSILMAPDPWAAERRWMDAEPPESEGTVRMIRITRSPESDPAAPLRIRLVSLRELRPPDDPRQPSPDTAHGQDNLGQDNLGQDNLGQDNLLRPGRLRGRFVVPQVEGDGLIVEPHPEDRLEASLHAELVPALGDRLVGSLRLDAGSDGARVRVEVQHDAGGRGSRKVVLFERSLPPGGATALELPLDPWVGQRVWLRLVVLNEGEDGFDRVRIPWLRVHRGDGPATIAGALRDTAQRETADSDAAAGRPAHVTGYGDVFLHPEAPDAPPVEVRVPMTGGGCLATGLQHTGTEGDGAWMEGLVEPGGDLDEEVLFRAHLNPGDRQSLPPIPLPTQDFVLVLRVRPGLTNSFDWTRFVLPRRVPCPLSPEQAGDLLAAFAAGAGRALHTHPSWDAEALFLHPNAPSAPPSELRFEVVPEHATCVSLSAENRGTSGDGVTLTVSLQDGEHEHEVGQVLVRPGQTGTLEPTPMPALESPRGELILRLTPGENTETDWLYLQRAELQACP